LLGERTSPIASLMALKLPHGRKRALGNKIDAFTL
jgi:hypothetical protein